MSHFSLRNELSSVNPIINRFLLVEDDPNDVELIGLALEELNLTKQLDVVTDGVQALQYLHGDANKPACVYLPRLVLLDLKLPLLNGIEVLRAIRQHPRTRNLVVVVLTSSAENLDLEACYNLGVNSYVVKPLTFEKFVNVTRQIGEYWVMLNQIPNSNY